MLVGIDWALISTRT